MTLPAYIQPSSTTPLPGSLTLTQFLQGVLVGISGITGTLVRPSWQTEPPKQPDLAVNWLAFGVSVQTPDANSYIGVDENDHFVSQRHETLDIEVSLYGPEAAENYGILRDGFQIPPNLAALGAANMGFVEIAPARRLPDFVNGRFINRVQTNIFLRREIQRVYPIVTLLSATGTIHTILDGDAYSLDWET